MSPYRRLADLTSRKCINALQKELNRTKVLLEAKSRPHGKLVTSSTSQVGQGLVKLL